ncbi:MAG: hypothetical protein IPJ88_09025 [Myxococcales bacterium]|nr:MAG: hypothetical protein IPJ88_09025 [Myxococcales bacterium]
MSAQKDTRCDQLVKELTLRYPSFALISKQQSTVCRMIDFALRVVTLNMNRSFMIDVVTTLGQVIYLPRDWSKRSDAERYAVLRHEAVHLEQFSRLGFFVMAVVYVFVFFPFGLAWGRARLEWQAYEETMRVHSELYGIRALEQDAFRRKLVRLFTGPAYGWMWPFPRTIERWYDKSLSSIRGDSN